MIRSWRPAVLVLATVAGLAGAASAWVHVLVPGQKAFGIVDEAGEVDEVWFRADAGWKVSFTLKARRGGTLLPVFAKLTDPDGADGLGSAVVKTGGKGTVARLRFTAAKSGSWVLGITGDGGSTGTWDLASKGPGKIPLGAGSIEAAGAENLHGFDADAGTEATIRVKAAAGSSLEPRILRLSRPGGAGDADLSAAARKTAKRSDTLSKFVLGENGTWTLGVGGASGTTGAYTATLKVGKKVPLDFSEDPPPGPPPVPAPVVDSVSPTSFAIPGAGTESKSLTVDGARFQSGAAASLFAASGTNGISNVATAFVSANRLTVTFDLAAGATPGARSVTVTNPDTKSGTLAAAFTLTAAPALALTSVTPSTGPGAGGIRVLLQGDLFDPAAAVTFGGVPARALNVVDSRNILCTVPPAASLSKTAGTPADVTVDNGGGDTATLAGGFTYDPDPTRPKVLAAVPAAGATGVATNLQKVVLVLDEPVDPAPVTTSNFDFFRSAASGPNDIQVPRVTAAAVGVGGRRVVINRGAAAGGPLTANSIYIAQVHKSGQTSGFLTDVAGNPLDPSPFAGPVFQTSFTTGAGTDFTAPAVTGTIPAAGAAGVDVDSSMSLTFGKPVDPTLVEAAVSLQEAGTPVPADLDMDATCTVVTLTPRRKLLPATPYTLAVSTTLRDLMGNPLGGSFASMFTTAASDATPPTQKLTVDDLPQDLNGSGTYVPGTSNGGTPSVPGPAAAFNVFLPLSGFTLDVSFADLGGSGVDASTFSCTCSAAMGGVAAGQDLASLFTVTPLGARWTVDASHAPAAGNGIAFTVGVKDLAGNAAAAAVLAVDAASISGVPSGKSGDRDPFNSRQSWLLRFDQDVYSISSSAGGTGSHSKPITVSSAAGADGTKDFQQDLALLGLNGPMTGTNASTATNGPDTGTNAIVQTMVRKAVRGFLNRRYGIAYDGTRSAGSADIEFLLEGEALAAGGTATAASWTSSSAWSMMTFTGDERANASGGTIGRATLDFRNRGQESDSNDPLAAAGTNLGTFGTHMIRVRINDFDSTSFPATFDPLISLAGRGGTPVGSGNDDAVVLAGSFDYATATATRKARFDAISLAVNRYALYLSAIGAHEIGHSTGLVPDGPPPAGLFGNAHPGNTFIATGTYTTPSHIDTPGPNEMEAAASFDDTIATGSDFMTFEPLSLAYLLRRMIYDQ